MDRDDDGNEGTSARVGGVPFGGLGFAIPAFVILAIARRYGYVADVSLGLILGELALILLATELFTNRFPPGSARARPRLHLLLQISLIGLLIYTLGWGALLAVGFVFPAANIMSRDGSRYGPWAIAWIAITVVTGEILASVGVFKTLVTGHTEHGLAFLAVAGTCAVVAIITFNQREKEEIERSVVESERRFRALVQHASDVIIVVSRENTITYVSPAFETTLGYDASESVGMEARLLIPNADTSQWATLVSNLDSGASVQQAEFKLRHRDGSLLWCEGTFTNLGEMPGVNGWVANVRDITKRKLAEAAQKETDAALREAQEVFRHAFDEAGAAMTLVDPDGMILRSNEAMALMLGYETGDRLEGESEIEITHPEDRYQLSELYRGLKDDGLEGFRTEKRYVHVQGHVIWVAMTVSMVRDDEESALYSICQLEDITERKAESDQLAFEAAHDTLTGLVNRARFTQKLIHALQSSDKPVALLFIDLDHFKNVNDKLGHSAGDDLLVIASQRLRSAMRPDDLVARFGGDEFVVLCERIAVTDSAMQVADRIIKALAQPLTIAGANVGINASVGIAISNHGDTAETLLRKADAAMYQAKHEGRGRAVTFQHDRQGIASAVLRTGTDIHRALERDEFVVHYQPIVELSSGRIAGFEALIRWNHPERGFLTPSEFLGMAEETGLIVPIGTWVVQEACRQAVRRQEAYLCGDDYEDYDGQYNGNGNGNGNGNAAGGGTRHDGNGHDGSGDCGFGGEELTVNVNVSQQQIADPRFVDVVSRAIRNSKIQPSSLWLEVTEDTLMSATAPILEVIRELQEMGVKLCIDDFGTGCSSVASLKRFRIDGIKIDGSCLEGLGSDPESRHVVTTIVDLAHSLGARAIAEGLETREQLEVLKSVGCDFAQGYLLARPLSPQASGNQPQRQIVDWDELLGVKTPEVAGSKTPV